MAQTGERTGRRLPGSPRAEGGKRQQQGGSGGTDQRSLSTAPAVGGGRRVGNRGGNQGRSRHRRAPAFPTPQARPRLAPPPSVDALPWPRPLPASSPAPGRPLPAGGFLRPRLPPLVPARACAPPAVSLQGPRGRAPCASRSPPRPPAGCSAFGRLAGMPPSAGWGNLGTRLRRVGRNVPRQPPNRGVNFPGWATRSGVGCDPRSPGLGTPAGAQARSTGPRRLPAGSRLWNPHWASGCGCD